MADTVANIAKGRAIELFNRVKAGDPAASRLYLIPITNNGGALTDAEFADADDFAAVITAGAVERSTGNWNRKTIAAADIATLTPDDTNDRFDVDIVNDQSWSPGPTAGLDTTDLVLCYASVASPTNAQLLPIGKFAFAVTTDGNVVNAIFNAAGVYRAS